MNCPRPGKECNEFMCGSCIGGICQESETHCDFCNEIYDEFKLSKDYGIIMLKLALILLVGAIGYVLISKLVLWISIVIWIVYFVKFTVTFRFDKYKINTNN